MTTLRLYIEGIVAFVWYRLLDILSWSGRATFRLIEWVSFFIGWVIPAWLKEGWQWGMAHKVRILWTLLLLATIIGFTAAFYLWRREIASGLAASAGYMFTRVRGLFRNRAAVTPDVVETEQQDKYPLNVWD